MKWLDKFTKKFVKKASAAAKKEAKKTAYDVLPKLIGIGAAIGGILIFKEGVRDVKPTLTATHIITNNYFLGNAGADVIKKLLEKEDY